MANSYENTIMPEKPVEQIKPDAIPVDDKGQPLPDPTENLSSYIAPKGVEELRKAYSEVEVDEDVRKTMEPPQKTGLLRKHRAGKRGYDYYGTPAGSVPNDGNGLNPSPLSKLFSEAEALEPDFDLEKIREHVLQQTPEEGSEYRVVETPKLDQSAVKNPAGADAKTDDVLKKPEVIKDPNAPKFLDLYKESTNTRVIFQSDAQDSEGTQSSKSADGAQQIFAEHSQVTKVKKRLNKREEKKAIKAAIKAEKKAAKERRKAEKAARKAAKKAARKGIALESPAATSPDEIIKLREENAEKAAEEKIKSAEMQAEDTKRAEEAAKAAKEEAEKAVSEKAEAEKQLEIANRQKEEAELEAQRMAQEAEKRLQKEKEALRKQKKETKAVQKEKEQVLLQLDEEKAAAKKAAKEAKFAREEAERLKAELEAMKEAAAQALAQKQEAEEAARIALEEKEKTDMQMPDSDEKSKKENIESVQENESEQQKEENAAESIEKTVKEQNESEEKPIIKSVMEKYHNEKKAAEKTSEAEMKAETEKNGRKYKKNESGDIYINSPTTEIIKRRIAKMEAQLSSNNSDVK